MSDSYEGAERLVAQFSTQRDSTLDACASTIAEGESLLAELGKSSLVGGRLRTLGIGE